MKNKIKDSPFVFGNYPGHIEELLIQLRSVCRSDEMGEKAQDMILNHNIGFESMIDFIACFGILPTKEYLKAISCGVSIRCLITLETMDLLNENK